MCSMRGILLGPILVAPTLVALFVVSTAAAQAPRGDEPTEEVHWTEEGAEISILAGLIQPILLQGGNVEVDLHWRRLVVGYSHGFLLTLEGSTVVGEASRQHLGFDLPWSTGLSLGVRIFSWLDVRGELKAHRFEVRYDGTSGNEDSLFEYTTWTLGVGVYARWQPFAAFDNWASGITTSTSVRFWPTIGTSIGGPDTTISYDNSLTGATEEHEVSNIGMANTPFIFNIAIGYAFDVN